MTYTINTQHHIASVEFDKKERVVKADPHLAWMYGRTRQQVEEICIRRGYTFTQHD